MLPHLSIALGREVRVDEITEYYFDAALGLAPEVWNPIWEEHEHRLYAEALPYPGVREGLAALTEMGQLVIQTGRPDSAAAATRAWIATYLDVPIEIHFRSQRAKYTAEDRVDYFVEDHLPTLLSAAHGYGVLVDRPWNRAGAPEHTQRVSNLLEAARVIEGDLAMRARRGGAR
jgi:uncharacterized HAD superfamily protein